MIRHSGWNEGNQSIGTCFHLFFGLEAVRDANIYFFHALALHDLRVNHPNDPWSGSTTQNSHTYTSNESNDSSDLIQKDMFSLRASGSDKLGEILKIKEIGDCFVHHSVSERCAKGAVSGVMHWISLQRCSDDRFSRSVKGRISLQTKTL